MLIGREHEQQVIDRLVSGARIGASGVLAVTGEPGVGKTSLIRWTEGRLDGFRVLRATGTEPEREVPFGGLLAVLRPALGLIDTIAAPQARALSAALAMEEGPAVDRFAIGAATLSLLCRYAEEAPVAVLLDDLHLLDPSSAGALVFAARRLSSDPVAMVVLARAGEAEDLLDGLQRLSLAGLDLPASRSLVDGLSVAPVTDEWLTRVHELTGGNPLAITELADHPDALLPTGADVPPPLSSALAASFTRRVRLLAPSARAVLLVAVVSNGDLRLTGSVCTALGLDVAELADAQHAGLADVVGGEVTFRHPLLRAAMYRDSPPDERRAVHAAVARALPRDEADRRAWHLSESLWAPDAEVAEMLDGAAVRAVARSAYAVASTAYERAARLSPSGDDLAVRLVAAAENAWAAGLTPRAVALLDELAARTLAPEPAVSVLELRASIAVRTGSVREAATLFESVAAETDSADVRAVLLAEALHATFFLIDGAAAGRLVESLTLAVQEATSTRSRAIGTVAAGMAKVLAGRGGIRELRAAVPLLAASAELRSEAHGLSWLMYVPLFLRDAETGHELRARVEEERARAGVGTLPALLFLVARDGAASDSWARAAADYTEAIRLARDTGQATELAMSLAGLSWLEARTGQETECREHAAEALALCGSSRPPPGARRPAGVALGGRPRPLAPGRARRRAAATRPRRRGHADRCVVRRVRGREGAALGAGAGSAVPRSGGGRRSRRPVPRGAGAARPDAGRLRDGPHGSGVRRTPPSRGPAGRRPEAPPPRARRLHRARGRRLGRPCRDGARPHGRAGAATRGRRCRVPDPAGAPGGSAARRRPDDARCSRRTVPQPEDGGVPPPQGLHQARDPLSRRADRRRRACLTGSLASCRARACVPCRKGRRGEPLLHSRSQPLATSRRR